MIKCIVIDDEPFALKLIEGYIKKTPFLEFGGSFSNPLKALEFINAGTVDIIFLDINMPELSGIQFLKTLANPPGVIFTTAYPEYGVESYNYNSIDYLLKPIEYDRFLKACNKASEILERKISVPREPVDSNSLDYILVKSGLKYFRIRLDEIFFIEGAGNYMTFHTKEKKIMSLLTVNEVLEMLPSSLFVRIHKSYIISFDKIDSIESNDVIIKGREIPIGATYKQLFFNLISTKNRQ